MESSSRKHHVRCIVKLGGAAITFKDKLEALNRESLSRTSLQLHEAMGGGVSFNMDWSKNLEVPDPIDMELHQKHAFVVVHGAGSFGHFQASISGVNKGGLDNSLLVNAGFVATRLSVTKLNHKVIRALASQGIPAVGMPPFAAGWSTHKRILDCDNVSGVREVVDAGFVPVLHGDAVRDSHQGCCILSGDVIVRRLAEELQPSYVVFLTNVPGVFDRPPSEENAVLLQEIVVYEDGTWSIARPRLEAPVKTEMASHDTTGGMATKIAEAASISRLGMDVYIVEAGTEHALQALKGNIEQNWIGTIVRKANST
ncbi:uncharacterized protein LOC9645519 [Selaginella moellendorffii]|uniref:uncharacterized protein LOC9645519 n=1 Tax=Selaginella moellendorffii TaxID=88036 RepID=UPI000D1C3C17|nr:uncharacterized protein LOC9645519 [Selaginella moellendorffii]|eukprot:XP_024530450.1 uncharacterized protein LOC9645519 [Selaginella moellendorffii]